MKRASERLSKCQLWIPYPPTHNLLKASLMHILKTRKLSSRWLSKDEVQQWDTCPEPTELRLIGCSTESTWNRRSKSNMWTPKTNSLTWFHAWRVEPSSSFVQHHEFLDVLLQSFQQFSFWSDRNAERCVKERSRSDFQWRFNDGETKTPMVPAKTRPVNLVWRSPWSARENPPQDLGYPVDTVDADEGQGSQTSSRKLVRTTQSPEVESSQVRRQEMLNIQIWKQGGRNLRTRLVQGNLYGQWPLRQKKLGITAGHSTFSMEGLKTNVLIWRMFMSSSMKSAIHLGPKLFGEFGSLQGHELRRKLIFEHSEEILNVNTIHSTSPSWTRSVLSHDQVVQWTGKSTCLLRFRTLSGESEW